MLKIIAALFTILVSLGILLPYLISTDNLPLSVIVGCLLSFLYVLFVVGKIFFGQDFINLKKKAIRVINDGI